MTLSFRPHFEGGGVERLIKDGILHPLDFSNLDYCIDCIKEKYAKQVKKGEAKRSTGVLEIIHMDICGPFPVKSVDGFDSFITFTDDFFHSMAIFIQLKNDRKCWINLRYLMLR
jgi:hypothetical protein